jgi:hypothetical protein
MTTPGIIEQLDRCLAFENELIATVGEEFYIWIADRATKRAASAGNEGHVTLDENTDVLALINDLERTIREAAAAERERIAQWMIANSLATGHGDTVEDLLGEAAGQIRELRAQNAQLVAALKEARDELESWYDAKNVLATINAALAAAGHKP